MSKLKIDKNDEKKSALILYSLSCLLNEAGKIAVLTVFFLVQRRWEEFITAFITIASLRIFGIIPDLERAAFDFGSKNNLWRSTVHEI